MYTRRQQGAKAPCWLHCLMLNPACGTWDRIRNPGIWTWNLSTVWGLGDLAWSKLRTPGPQIIPGRGPAGTPNPRTQDSKKNVQKVVPSVHPFKYFLKDFVPRARFPREGAWGVSGPRTPHSGFRGLGLADFSSSLPSF